MWKLRPQHTIGIQILVTTRLTYALVLLTANLEDVKKIARQFVDESVADQIANFLVQAGVTQATNISEENLQNENFNEISDDEWNVYHPSPQSSSDEELETRATDAVNRVKANKHRTDRRPVATPKKPKVFPFKKIDKDIKRDLNLNSISVKKTTSYYTYDLILTQDYKQTPKFEWRKEVSFDAAPNVNFDIPRTNYHDTIEPPIEKEKPEERFKKFNDYYPKKIVATTLKPSHQPTADYDLKKKKTSDADNIIRIDELKREIEEKFESRFNEMETVPTKTYKRPKPNLEPLQHSPAKTKTKKISETNETKREGMEKTGSTRLRDLSDVTNKYGRNRFDYKDSIYVKKQIVATSGPVQLLKSTPAPPGLRLKDPLEDFLSNRKDYATEHKGFDDSLYFKRHLENLFRRQNGELNSKIDNITYTNRLDDSENDSRILSMEGEFKNDRHGEERDEVLKLLSQKLERGKNVNTIDDGVRSSKENDEYRRMKLEETPTNDYVNNENYKSSVSYGDYF